MENTVTPRKVMLTTDGKILVSGEKGIAEITDKDFISYITKGLKLKEVELDGISQVCADTAYNEIFSRQIPLGPTKEPEFPSKETSDMPDRLLKGEDSGSDRQGSSEKEQVNHPKHYNSHPSGIECIEIARHYNFDIGNAIKYLWRHGLKSEEGKNDTQKSIEDLEKAIWYIVDEIYNLNPQWKPDRLKFLVKSTTRELKIRGFGGNAKPKVD